MASTSTTTRNIERPPFVIFGYGSLIFKAQAVRSDFAHWCLTVPGFLKGYVRRFAQKSHDHRGTPENPGRMDWNKFPSSDPFPHEDIVCGIAYTIDPAYESEVRDYLGPDTAFSYLKVNPSDEDGHALDTIDVYGVNSADSKADKVIIQGAYVSRRAFAF
ncbi:ChaC-like protein-domain-containing protein [Armillaria luteobubalina]|uniref:glutathione-specific gamma-glutamylcyclotransferase n=1 Tax=Armillaria luteobubalina TaxID=153913 RepID=A0AA39P848_9AGAR|nr:ChaC-like protein-domain-containing protein [Armillaria luteobubalina]